MSMYCLVRRYAAPSISRLLVFTCACALVGCESSPDEQVKAGKKDARIADPVSNGATFRDQSLVNRDALKESLGDPNVRILDTRAADEYATAHIPGAILVDVDAWKSHAESPGGLDDAAFWANAIGALGVGPETTVVVYGGKSLSNAARVWWHLRYAGAPRVKLLDGGWPIWKSGGLPTESTAPEIGAKKFTPSFQKQLLADASDVLSIVQSGAGDATIVDCRSPGEFEGKDVAGRGGHVPGAVHLEWTELLGDDGLFKSDKELKALFEERGVSMEQPAIAHCQSGGRSSVEVFGLMLAGHKDAKNYYGGWGDWSSDEARPVE